jgi:hypothetical protein
MFLELLIIALVNVLIIDLSGFTNTLKLFISKHLTNSKITTTNFSIKPFDCSFCMNFWTGLLFTIVTGQFTLVNLLIILLLSFFTPSIKDFLLTIRDLISKLTIIIYDKFIKD